jgi:hypothetical protein
MVINCIASGRWFLRLAVLTCKTKQYTVPWK